MSALKAVTSVLNDTTNMVNAGKHLGHALGFKSDKHYDKHHDICGHENYLKPGKHHKHGEF